MSPEGLQSFFIEPCDRDWVSSVSAALPSSLCAAFLLGFRLDPPTL